MFDSEIALKWGGVGLVVLAVGFAVSTAISRGWIGPELQLAGALAVSLALIVTGARLRPTRPTWTHALCTGGVLALFTTFASDLFLDQANDNVAFAATAASAAIGIALARHVVSQWVATATVVGGAIAWTVIADGEPPFVATVSLIVVGAAAAIVLSVEQAWHASRLVAHAVAMLEILAMAAESDHGRHHVLVLAAAALVAASLVRLPSLGDLTTAWQQLEVQLTIGTAPWVFAVIAITFELDSDTTVGATAIAVAAGAAFAALGVRRWITSAHFVSLAIGASVSLSIGLAALLSTTVAFTALAVQGAGLVILSQALGRNIRVMINAAVVVIISGVFVLTTMVEAWTDDMPIGDDVAHLGILGAIAVAVWQTNHVQIRQVGAIALLSLVLIWLGSVLVHLPQGQAAVSVSWAIIGTAILVSGAVRRRADVGALGLAVLALTVGKLLTVDLQEVDTLWRAGLFLVVGLGFLRLGFLLPRLSNDDEPT